MAAEAAPAKPKKPRKPRKKSTAISANFATKVGNGNALLLDGNLDGRSLAARRFRELNLAIASDLGGADQLSAVQAQIVKRFSGVSVLGEMLEARLVAGDPELDLGAYATLLNSSARLAQLVGLKRQPRVSERRGGGHRSTAPGP